MGFRNYFVDFPPSAFDAGYVVQGRRVFPEGPCFDVVDESDGAEIHVLGAESLDGRCFGDIAWIGRARVRAFGGHWIGFGNSRAVLCAAKYIWQERMIIQAPNPVGSSRLESVSLDQLSDQLQISTMA